MGKDSTPGISCPKRIDLKGPLGFSHGPIFLHGGHRTGINPYSRWLSGSGFKKPQAIEELLNRRHPAKPQADFVGFVARGCSGTQILCGSKSKSWGKPQVLVFGSIYQGAILVHVFEPQPIGLASHQLGWIC